MGGGWACPAVQTAGYKMVDVISTSLVTNVTLPEFATFRKHFWEAIVGCVIY